MQGINNQVIETAHQRMQQMRELMGHISTGYLLLGKILTESKANNDYKSMGYKKMTHYVADYLNLKPSTYYQIVQVYETFGHLIETNELQGIDFTRLRALVSVKIQNENDKLEILHKAKTLTTRDFYDMVRTMKGKVSCIDCEHDYQPYMQCTKCGHILKNIENQEDKEG